MNQATLELRKIGVVTVTYNSGEVLKDFLASVFAQTDRDFILYVVDNASQDSTVGVLRDLDDSRVRLLLQPENVGFAVGNNIGIRAALADNCKLVLLINNDVLFERELFQKLRHGIDEFRCDMVAPKMKLNEPGNCIWWAGGGFGFGIVYPNYHRGVYEPDEGQYDTPEQVDFAPACCLLLSSEVFEKIGLFDSQYFVYFEDADFMLRARRSQLRLFYLPNAVLYHKASSLTGGSESEFIVSIMAKNRVYFWRKHYGPICTSLYSFLISLYYISRLLKRKSSFTCTWGQIRTTLIAFARFCAPDPTRTACAPKTGR